VGLVHHHERQAEEEVRPSRVVRQQARVQHVRVGQHQVGVAADQGSLGPRGVAVVDSRLELRQPELTDLPQLVPGQGLGRVQVQRRALRVVQRIYGEGQVVHERLAAGRPRGDHDVVTPAHPLQCPALVRVQASHAEQPEPFHQDLRQVAREREGFVPSGRDLAQVGERVSAGLGGASQQLQGIHPADATGGSGAPGVPAHSRVRCR
jgi:hypothetical protein